MGKNLIIVVIIALAVLGGFVFLVGMGEDSAVPGALEETTNVLEEKRGEAIQKRNEALQKSNTARIALMVDDWFIASGSYINFLTNQANKTAVDNLIAEWEQQAEVGVKYNVFTTANNFVVKTKYAKDEEFYCIDPDNLNKVVNIADNNFSSTVDCNGNPL